LRRQRTASRNACGEASVLEDSQHGHREKEKDAYKLHMVLDTEELMLNIEASIGAIGKLRDQP
jgi:hypothetical protein